MTDEHATPLFGPDEYGDIVYKELKVTVEQPGRDPFCITGNTFDLRVDEVVGAVRIAEYTPYEKHPNGGFSHELVRIHYFSHSRGGITFELGDRIPCGDEGPNDCGTLDEEELQVRVVDPGYYQVGGRLRRYSCPGCGKEKVHLQVEDSSMKTFGKEEGRQLWETIKQGDVGCVKSKDGREAEVHLHE